MTATAPGEFGAYVVISEVDAVASDARIVASYVGYNGFLGGALAAYNDGTSPLTEVGDGAQYDAAYDGEDVTKYGFTVTADTTAFAADMTWTVAFNMPEEADSPPEAAETVLATGDRLDKGAEIAAWAGAWVDATAPTMAACNADALTKVKLGAVALAAGSAAFAAALAF